MTRSKPPCSPPARHAASPGDRPPASGARRIHLRFFAGILAMALVASACAGTTSTADSEAGDEPTSSTTDTSTGDVEDPEDTADEEREAADQPIGGTSRTSDGPAAPPTSLPPAPESIPTGALDPEIADKMANLFSSDGLRWFEVEDLGETDDVRLAWPITDAFRFLVGGEFDLVFSRALENLTGEAIEGPTAWVGYQDLLLAWDVPAPPGYLEFKTDLFRRVDPGWEIFFDPESPLDWREVNSGGVRKDGIPALNDPALTSGDNSGWADETVVFGIEVGDEARAYPRLAMEVHELVNDTLGERRVGVPYCTLCKSATAYLTDEPPDGFDTIDLRTSGLLRLSNKLMYDVATDSLFDQFFGQALTGPLREAGYELTQLPLVTTTWGDWRATHPSSTIITTNAGGDDVDYDRESFLDGRDANGPIFPVGEVDDRLGAQTTVLGVESPQGSAVAFPVDLAKAELAAGRTVEADGVELVDSAGGLLARVIGTGESVRGHESFWFAWAQFRPDTGIWESGP